MNFYHARSLTAAGPPRWRRPQGLSSRPLGNRRWAWYQALVSLGLALWGNAWAGPAAAAAETALPYPYEYRSPASPDGIGKFYQGREIAQLMSHLRADWLERPERAAEEAPEKVMAALAVQSGAVVADLGAGTGYYTRRLAAAVGPAGRVYAVELQPELLERLRADLAARGLSWVVPVPGTEQDPRLPPESLDLVLMVDVYHELAWPHEVLTALCRALKPGGRLAVVEYRAEDPDVPIKPLHKMSVAQIRRELALHPLEWVRTVSDLPWQHVVIFRKPGAAARPAGPSP